MHGFRNAQILTQPEFQKTLGEEEALISTCIMYPIKGQDVCSANHPLSGFVGKDEARVSLS